MPVEIKEVVIRAIVDKTTSGSSGGGGQGTATTGEVNRELVQLCVDEVLKVLKNKRRP